MTDSCEGEVKAEERAAMLVAGIYIKKDDDESRNWSRGRILMVATAIANEMYTERRVSCRPTDVSEVFQVELAMLHAMHLNIDFGNDTQWCDLVCDAPHTWSRRSRVPGRSGTRK